MKILQVIHSFFPEGFGGSEVYAYNLAKELAKKHEVFIFYRIADPELEEYAMVKGQYDGLPVYKINNTWKNYHAFEDTYKNDALAQKFGVLLDELQPDVVHFHHLTCLSTTLIEEAKKRGMPVVFTLHDYWLICQRGQFLRRDLSLCRRPTQAGCAVCWAHQVKLKRGSQALARILGRLKPDLEMERSLKNRVWSFLNHIYIQLMFCYEKKALRQIKAREQHIKQICAAVDLFIAPSQFLRDKFVEFGIPPKKIIYSDNGLDTSLFLNFSREKSEVLRFGFIGALIPPKGVHVLIKAFNQVKGNATLKIYGPAIAYDGVKDYFKTLEKMKTNPRIIFTGPYAHKDISRIFSKIDVLIVPSIWHEIGPLTIKEAFMFKVPVIASNIVGMAEQVINDKIGLLFQMGKAKDLYKKINSFIDDPGPIAKLTNDIKSVKSIKDNCKELEKIYRVFLKTNS